MNKTRWGAVLAILTLAGCGGEGDGPVAYPDARHEALEAAPAVDLTEMTENPSGLYLLDLAVGEGAEAAPGQTVFVHYTGWFQDGEKFDSSVDRGQAFDFTLGAGQVIRGWDEGVAGMKVGGWRRLVLPPELAYGADGRSGIPPNSTLIFDVELLDVGGE